MIRVYFPTIMSGAVVRWYAGPEAYATSSAVASASADHVTVYQGSADLAREVATCHEEMRAAGADRAHDVAKRWATHRTVGLFSRDLVAVSS